MPLPTELTVLMNDEVILEPKTGTDKFNNKTYGAAVTVHCYLVRANVVAIGKGGAETTSTVQAFLANPDLVVGVDDRLTLPDGTQPPIIEVLAAPDDTGQPYYLEVRA